MASPKGKLKWFADWAYVFKIARWEQLPSLTTEDGVRIILAGNGLGPDAIAAQLRELDEGGSFESNVGLFRHVHKRVPIVEERLRQIAASLSEATHYSACWWHAKSGTVWWSYAAEDSHAMLRTGSHCCNFGEIRRRFMEVHGVSNVKFAEESVPDRRRDPSWAEVYPCRI
jgi:hypothetical protein